MAYFFLFLTNYSSLEKTNQIMNNQSSIHQLKLTTNPNCLVVVENENSEKICYDCSHYSHLSKLSIFLDTQGVINFMHIEILLRCLFIRIMSFSEKLIKKHDIHLLHMHKEKSWICFGKSFGFKKVGNFYLFVLGTSKLSNLLKGVRGLLSLLDVSKCRGDIE